MGCDYHQFFTKKDLDAGNIEFIDTFTDEIVDVSEAMKIAYEVTADYVQVCTTRNSTETFHYFLDNDAILVMQGELNYADWTKRVPDTFSKLTYVSDANYVKGFEDAFRNYTFPEATKPMFAQMFSLYMNCKESTRAMLFNALTSCDDKIVSYCNKLLDDNGFKLEKWLDIDMRSYPIAVGVKRGSDATVLHATTC